MFELKVSFICYFNSKVFSMKRRYIFNQEQFTCVSDVQVNLSGMQKYFDNLINFLVKLRNLIQTLTSKIYLQKAVQLVDSNLPLPINTKSIFYSKFSLEDFSVICPYTDHNLLVLDIP